MLFKTDEDCPLKGIYRYSGHPDHSRGCHPQWKETDIVLEKGDKFPAVGLCHKPAQWVFVRPP